MPPLLPTARLLLRPLAAADVPGVFAACADPRLTAFTLFDTHRTPADSEAFVFGYALTNYARGVPEPFAITWQANPAEVIGCCGAFPVAGMPGVLECGYWVRVPDWGKGVATEAVGELVRFALTDPACERVRARVIVGNAASAAVVRKLGFVRQAKSEAVTRRGQTDAVEVWVRER